MIRHQVKLHLRIGGKESIQKFFVLNLEEKNNVILGFLWLNWHNPAIDWASGTVELKGTPTKRHDNPEEIDQRYLL